MHCVLQFLLVFFILIANFLTVSVAASSLIWYALYSFVLLFFFKFALQLIAYGFCRVVSVLTHQ